MTIANDILQKLSNMGIEYQMARHPPAHTIADCQWAEKQLDAMVPKNLFLAPRNLSKFHLCVVHPHAEFRTADVSKQIGSSRLSFGPEDKLSQLLHTYPGAISPLGLLFPESREVTLLMDAKLVSAPRLAFHPNDNTMTLAMSSTDFFQVLLPESGHVPIFVNV